MHFSPSQIDTFRTCPRKWALEKIGQVPKGTSASAALGSRVHGILERYLKGEAVDLMLREGEIALAGLGYLPPPMAPGSAVEGAAVLYLGGHEVHARMDLMCKPEDLPGQGEAPDVDLCILDHKTTTDFKWAKTPEILMRDAQAALYALYAYLLGARRVLLRWVYYRTTPPFQARAVDLYVSPADMAPEILRCRADMDAMAAIWETRDYPDPDVSGCQKYGGCPYRDGHPCIVTPEEALRAVMRRPRRIEDT